jgi:hypothetical protein
MIVYVHGLEQCQWEQCEGGHEADDAVARGMVVFGNLDMSTKSRLLLLGEMPRRGGD